jgi:uncharacterized protein
MMSVATSTDDLYGSADAERWLRGDWMITRTGRRFFPLDPKPEDVNVYDIAHALAHICRYGGHVPSFYSVAQHSSLMADHFYDLGEPVLALWALVHDAAEAYIGDMIKPLKRDMPAFVAAEARLENVIWRALGMTEVGGCPFNGIPEQVHYADKRMYTSERLAFFPDADKLGRKPTQEPLIQPSLLIPTWSPGEARTAWLSRFIELAEDVDLRPLRTAMSFPVSCAMSYGGRTREAV